MNTLADYGDESDEDSPRRRSFHIEPTEVASSTNSQHNSAHLSKQQRSPEHSPRPRRDSDLMFDGKHSTFGFFLLFVIP
ncbi:hypothetical protein Y032_0092g2534 [Ancylostoma ceylanicum]|uniref:Uncharacterized protein n=1 Tax=Ancylostoma ceylanicum TaxID=53326 RepID=A0A016TLS4_9BILA|nr:hypothetical protein Y032_0092g2534 [Ancylostoma ceylanicum]